VPKTYEVTEKSAQEIRVEMERPENNRFYKRLLTVALRGEGKENKEISEITGYHVKRVSQLVSCFCNEGLSALASDGRKGGNNCNMTKEEAAEFLGNFEAEAIRGRIPTVNEISIAYDEKTGKERKSKSTVYKFLHDNDWRIVVPKRQHPQKASDEAIEASKKLTSN